MKFPPKVTSGVFSATRRRIGAMTVFNGPSVSDHRRGGSWLSKARSGLGLIERPPPERERRFAWGG